MIRRGNRTPNFQATLLGIVLVLPVIAAGSDAYRGGPLVAVEIETMENSLDGCTACGSRAKGELESGRARQWWISFGLVKRDAENVWEAVGSASHSGSGPFKKASSDFIQTVGTPYLVVDVSMTVAAPSAGDVSVEMELEIQKLTGFDQNGQPAYTRATQKRILSFASEGGLTLPILIPDPRENESFAVHEVLLRLRATLLGREPAAYGSVSLSSDMPGTEVLLDGGFVGLITEDGPTLVKNVRVGTREFLVRDFSGREARQPVVVREGATAEVDLDILNLTPAGPRQDLVPIGKNPQGHEEYWRAKDGAMVVRIPAGEFLMGSPEGKGEQDERPQHRVHLSGFLIDKTEVTWRQFRKFTDAKGTSVPRTPVWGAADDYPAAFILWDEAKEYCEWVGGRLPTEAEWEKAARGDAGSVYPWGNDWDATRCNSISGGLHRPESVGRFRSCLSPYGVLDLSGSMWEWCADWYGESYYAESPPRDPKGPPSGRVRVMRGGAWMSQPTWLRAAYRFKASPSSRNADHGFRCAHDGAESPP